MAHRRRRYRSYRAFRKGEALTQGEAAARAGISQAEWSKYERGIRRPRPPTAAKLAALTGMPLTTLLGTNSSKLLMLLSLGLHGGAFT